MIEGQATYQRPFTWKLIEGPPFKPLIVLLHGYRQNKEIALNYWQSLQGLAHLLVVDGPLVHEFGQPRKIGCAWYVYDGDREKFKCEMDITCQSLQRLILDVGKKVDTNETWIGGFSQGAYLALYYGLCFDKKIQHVHSVAGNLNVNFVTTSLQNKKVWLHHCDQDHVCSVEKIKKLETLLKQKQCHVDRLCFSGGHEFLQEMTLPLKEELKKI